MTAWLFEGYRTVYVLLGVVLVVLAAAYWQTRRRDLLVAGAVVLGLLGLYFLLDLLIDTEPEIDRKQMIARIEQMADAVGRKDAVGLFEHIGDKFVSPAGRGRAETQAFARQVMASGQVREVLVWGFEFEKPPERSRGEATLHFTFKVVGTADPNSLAYPCDATFEWSGARGWLLRSVVIRNPVLTGEAIERPF